MNAYKEQKGRHNSCGVGTSAGSLLLLPYKFMDVFKMDHQFFVLVNKHGQATRAASRMNVWVETLAGKSKIRTLRSSTAILIVFLYRDCEVTRVGSWGGAKL